VAIALSAGRDLVTPSSLRIYDVAGRVVMSIEAGSLVKGTTTLKWDGLDDRGAPARTGMYFLSLEAAGRALASRKVMILR
jgi:flagellar hook assembly protein FlgD